MKTLTKILIALISAGAIIAAAFITRHYEQYGSKEHVFTGVVRSEGGGPVSGARINVFQDGQSQILYSDSDGVFHFREANEKKYLKITVEADGYEFFSRDTDPQRTGPEELYLHRNTRLGGPATTIGSPQIITKGNHSPAVIGNGNHVQ